jgi:hypothetical protein
MEVICFRWEFGWSLGCVKLVAKVAGLWSERVLGCFWKWNLDVFDEGPIRATREGGVNGSR